MKKKSRVVMTMCDFRHLTSIFVFHMQRRLGLRLARQVLKVTTVGDLHTWLRRYAANASN